MKANTPIIAIALGFTIGLSASCVPVATSLDPTHCNSNGGDSFCAEQYPDGSRPYCRLGNAACDEAGGVTDFDVDGCFEERPEDECYSACGKGLSLEDDPDCDPTAADDSSGGETNTDDTGTLDDTTDGNDTTVGDDDDDDDDTDGMTTDTTDGGGCVDDDDCADGGAPFCSDEGECVPCDQMPEPNTACAEADPDRPVCSEGTCVQCTPDDAAACDGQTPVCDDDNTCRACDEHSECPDACHLDGTNVGACFAEGDVVMAANTAQLETAFAGVGAGDDVVVVLTGTSYNSASIDFVAGAEIAVIGDGSQSISNDTSGGVIGTGGSSILYLSGVAVAGNITGDGITCSGTSVWLDDSEVRNNAQVGLDISGGCSAHLRRSVVRANSGGGIDQVSGELRLTNSAVALNGGTLSPFGGISLDGVDVVATYSTIAGNDSQNSGMSIRCSGMNSGTVRNCIISGADAASIDACSGVTLVDNAVDEMVLPGNTFVGAVDGGWFVDAVSGNFHLTASGEAEFMDIAQWQDGDPLADVNGDAIPTDMPSFPGYDQP